MCEPVSATMAATAIASIYMNRQASKREESVQRDAMAQQDAYQKKLEDQANQAKELEKQEAFKTSEMSSTFDDSSFVKQEAERKRRQGFQSTQASQIFGQKTEVDTLKKTLGGI